MKSRFLLRFILPVALLGTAGCGSTTTIIRNNIRQEALPVMPYYHTAPRNCQIEIGGIEDRRPIEEVSHINNGRLQYYIPHIFVFPFYFIGQFCLARAGAGPLYGNPEYYDSSLVQNLPLLMNDVLNKSGMYRKEGKKYLLKPELLHYYGVSYYTFSWMMALGGNKSTFFPTGFVSLKLTLYDKETSKVIGVRYLSEAFLFNPADSMLSIAHTAEHGTGYDIAECNMSGVAIIALKRAMRKFPAIIDQILSNENEATVPTASTPKTFTVIRLTREYDFQEEMNIEYETGKILRDSIVDRSLPVFSRPDEWVVSPVTEDGYWMSDEKYTGFINMLKQKYDVDFADNLSVAVFSGMR